MADPATMATVGMGMSAAKGAVGAFGALREGEAGAAMYRYKSGMALVNRSLALQNADYTRKMGEVQAGESGLKSRFQMGKITTAQSASGVDINSGTAVGVRAGQQKIAQIDQSLIRANAARRAYGYDVEAAKDLTESQMDLRAADDVKSASRISALSSILGGASSVSDKWMQASQYGVYSGSSSGGQVGLTTGDYYEAT